MGDSFAKVIYLTKWLTGVYNIFSFLIDAVIAMIGNVGYHAPHGGSIVLPVIYNRLMYVLAIIAGTVAVAITINIVKKGFKWSSENRGESRFFDTY